MPPIHTDALVLRTYKLGETSNVVVLLTRERGKVRAVAKGVRGPKAKGKAALQPLSEVRVGLYGRQGADLYRMGGCELLRSAFPAGGMKAEAGLVLSYWAELLDAFALEGVAEDAMYRLATAVIAAAGPRDREAIPKDEPRPIHSGAAEDQGGEPRLLSRYMETWLLKLHGLYPPVNRCVTCLQALPPGPLRYHRPDRAFRCESCGPVSGPVLSTDARTFLAEVFGKAPDAVRAVAPGDSSALESFHQSLIEAHLERDLRSIRVLKDVARS
jgi:DNA repair protein RecO (recombination protein O)